MIFLSYESKKPSECLFCKFYDRGGSSHRSVCSTNSGAAVRFINIYPRCCCDCPVASTCAVSGHAFTITTWALKIDDMTTWYFLINMAPMKN
jgi:hypothetical protein